MAGGFPVGYAISSASVGSTPSSSAGIAVTAGGPPGNTKGSYTQLIASTSVDASAILVTVRANTSGGLADIAVGGAGAEIVIAPNLYFLPQTVAAQSSIHTYILPVTIPAGSRIASRIQTTGSITTNYVSVTLLQDMLASYAPSGFIDGIGIDTTTSLLTSVDPGATANTKGSYSQLISSTARDYKAVILIVGQATGTTATGAQANSTVDIAVGGAGSEKIIIGDYQCFAPASISGLTYWKPTHGQLFPLFIPSGSRIAARAQNSINTATARLIGVALYGVP